MVLTKSNIKKTPKFRFETSWDDGSVLDLQTAKILEECGFVKNSTFYIVIDWVGTKGYLTWDQIKDLSNRGFEIGSHTMTHPMDLKELHDEFLFVELQTSKDAIEAVLDKGCQKLCYPRGRGDERVRKAVNNAGYIEARTTGEVGVIDGSDKLWLPGTIHIYPRDGYNGEPWQEYAKKVLAKAKLEAMNNDTVYFNLWGHSTELEQLNAWNDLRDFLNYIKENYGDNIDY